MEKFGKSQPVKRTEDHRFLTGQGRYMDDAVPDNALYAAFFRSPVAHARIIALDLDAAQQADGVRLVMTLDDLAATGIDTVMNAAIMPNRDGSQGAAPQRHMLAKDRVRFVGEPVVAVIAETQLQAQDAVELGWFCRARRYVRSRTAMQQNFHDFWIFDRRVAGCHHSLS